MKLAVPVAIILTAVLLAQPEPEELNIDFRGGRLPLNDLHLFGPNAKDHIEPEDEGLRILVPASEKAGRAVGVEANLEVDGDFVITTAYEVIGMEKPQKGNGPGVKLSMHSAAPNGDFITFAYRNHPSQGEIYFSNKGFTSPLGKTPGDGYKKPAQAAGKNGKLRLTRRGSMVIFSTAALDSDDFKELYRSVFVPGPVHQIRVSADPDKDSGRLEVRIYSLQIRQMNRPAVEAASGGTLRWLVIAGLVICVVLAAVYAGWRLWWRSPV